MVTYNRNSPWFKTTINDLYLETLTYRPIVQNRSDTVYVIENQYKHRPDLLAHDLYGDNKLWWVFVHRNRNVLKDPVFDFVPGVTIYLPNKTDLQASIRK